MFDIYCVILIVLVLIYLMYLTCRKPPNFPPGPPRLSLLGTIPPKAPKDAPHNNICIRVPEYIPKYGKTIGMYLGPFPLIWIHDPIVMRSLFARESASGRLAKIDYNKARNLHEDPNFYGLIIIDGIKYQNEKKFFLKTMKDFGYGKFDSEAIIKEEAKMIVEYLREKSGDDFFFQNTFNVPVVNVLWQMVASKRFDMEDSAVEDLMDNVNELLTSPKVRTMVFSPAFLSRHFPQITGHLFYKTISNKIHNFFSPAIEEIRKNMNSEEDPKNLVEAFYQSRAQDEQFPENCLHTMILDLFVAGSETTSTTLKWGVLLLATHQDFQEKCYEELKNVIGLDRMPELDDIKKLPYCEATISEVLRFSCIAPTSLPHRAMEDFYHDGYFYPKDSIILGNIHYIHTSPDYWTNPQQFDPNHFLDSEGRHISDLKQFMPFGIGRRACLGEALAKNELTLFFLSLVQAIKFGLPQDHPIPSTRNINVGTVASPHHFHVRLTSRVDVG